MAAFTGCQVMLELDSSVPFKKKLEMKRKVIENGGVISLIVTNKVHVDPASSSIHSVCVCES